MDIKKIEDFLSSKINVDDKTLTLLDKWESEISFMLNKKIKQKIIIEFLFENEKILKDRYKTKNKISTFQSLLSKFCSKLKSKKEVHNVKNKTVIESSNSSKEEFKNKDAGIVPKLNKDVNDKKDDEVIGKNSFFQLPIIKDVNVGLSESKNKNRIK